MFLYAQISGTLMCLFLLKTRVWQKWDGGKFYRLFGREIRHQPDENINIVIDGTQCPIAPTAKDAAYSAGFMVVIYMPLLALFWMYIIASLVGASRSLLGQQIPFLFFGYAVFPSVTVLLPFAVPFMIAISSYLKSLLWVPQSPSTDCVFGFANTPTVELVNSARSELGTAGFIATYPDNGRLLFAHNGVL